MADATDLPAAILPRFTLRHELLISICILLGSDAHGRLAILEMPSRDESNAYCTNIG